MERARRFYKDKLGPTFDRVHADGSCWIRSRDGSTIALLPRPDSKAAEQTALTFEVMDIDAEIRDLEQRGVKFEDYDLPGLKTVNHVFSGEEERCAWLTDSQGNILCLHQPCALTDRTAVRYR